MPRCCDGDTAIEAVSDSGTGHRCASAVGEHRRLWRRVELRGLERFATKAAARARVAAWIDQYNRDRKHTSVGMRSPIAYEHALREAA